MGTWNQLSQKITKIWAKLSFNDLNWDWQVSVPISLPTHVAWLNWVRSWTNIIPIIYFFCPFIFFLTGFQQAKTKSYSDIFPRSQLFLVELGGVARWLQTLSNGAPPLSKIEPVKWFQNPLTIGPGSIPDPPCPQILRTFIFDDSWMNFNDFPCMEAPGNNQNSSQMLPGTMLQTWSDKAMTQVRFCWKWRPGASQSATPNPLKVDPGSHKETPGHPKVGQGYLGSSNGRSRYQNVASRSPK